MKRNNLRYGFTLLEILTVLAIIAVLAALIFPVFVAARTKARETQCVSQMRQIVTALNIYRQDYDGADSSDTIAGMGLPTKESLYVLLKANYIPDKRLCLCPNRFVDPDPKWHINWYFSYESYHLFTNFVVKYQEDPLWPAVMCQYHDYAYWAERKTNYTTGKEKVHSDDRQILGVSLSGVLVRKKHKEFTNNNIPLKKNRANKSEKK